MMLLTPRGAYPRNPKHREKVPHQAYQNFLGKWLMYF
jgi:hypothetical protein